jgi:hypothetical protein
MNGMIAAKVLEYFKQQADAEPRLEEYRYYRKRERNIKQAYSGFGI